MSENKLQSIRDKITQNHAGDEQQLKVIFSDSPRVMVEAPAGYGKTTTMVSRLAYLYASGGIPNPKKILGLTFSVNAALKIKREVAEKLPTVLGEINDPVVVNERVTATNFHGFCKSVLRKYGYMISPFLKRDINLMKAVGKTDIEKTNAVQSMLSDESRRFICLIEERISSAELPDREEIEKYNQIVISEMLPHDYVTHNAVILLAIQLFESNPGIRQFYSDYYPLIVVDEFQDTNCMAWHLLNAIISEKTQLLFLGDPLQRIYGFIGAVPDIMRIAAEQFSMEKITLSKNYRFRNNPEMLKLDANIRRNAEMAFCISTEAAKLPAFWGKSQEDEAEAVVRKIERITQTVTNARIAILFRGRNENEAVFEEVLNRHNLDFFYGMFNDDDENYIQFHMFCRDAFISKFGASKSISRLALSSFAERVKANYSGGDTRATSSLFELLDALIQKVAIDYSDIPTEDKYELLLDIFENRQLKQAMEYVDSDIILSTVHGAKGLEWDFVFIADLERWIFPGYYICSQCTEKFSRLNSCKCKLPVKSNFTEPFTQSILDELSVFYVAITRARKQVYVSASAKKANNKDSAFSCFVTLDGIKLINAESE